MYKLHYLQDPPAFQSYQQSIRSTYSADKLNQLLHKLCRAIGGNVLNVAKQDYQPQGASVTLMISEEAEPQNLVAHLDKSHLCIHTYPEDNPQDNVAVFRADIELSTCGVISPLKVINYLVNEFEPDVVDIDYRVRGMTRDINGQPHFCDDKMLSIEEFLSQAILTRYSCLSNNLTDSLLFHSKLRIKEASLTSIRANQQQSLSKEQLENRFSAISKTIDLLAR